MGCHSWRLVLNLLRRVFRGHLLQLLLLEGLIVQELAASAVGAVHLLVEAFAQLRFVVFGHVRLLFEFVVPVSKRARIFVLAVAGCFPEFAHFCLVLNLELFWVLGSWCLFYLFIRTLSASCIFLAHRCGIVVFGLFLGLHLVEEVSWDWRIEACLLEVKSFLLRLKVDLLCRNIIIGWRSVRGPKLEWRAQLSCGICSSLIHAVKSGVAGLGGSCWETLIADEARICSARLESECWNIQVQLWVLLPES
jgi:hypothetical protein